MQQRQGGAIQRTKDGGGRKDRLRGRNMERDEGGRKGVDDGVGRKQRKNQTETTGNTAEKARRPRRGEPGPE